MGMWSFLKTSAEREADETRELYAKVARLQREAGLSDPFDVSCGIFASFVERVPAPLVPAFYDVIRGVLELEPFAARPIPDLSRITMAEGVTLRRSLRQAEAALIQRERSLELMTSCLWDILSQVVDAVPETEAISPFTIPLINVIPKPNGFIDYIRMRVRDEECRNRELFARIRRTLYVNTCIASGIVPDSEPKKPYKDAADGDLSASGAVDAYLGGTPFCDFLHFPVPLRFTHEDRFSHMHVLGGSGAGKTTLLQNLILSDLKSDDPPAMVIVDSQGDLIDKLSHLALFDPNAGALADRLVLITPKDVRDPPALNIFDINRARLAEYDEAAREQVTAGVIQTFDYLFAGLLGADLTAKQGVFFRFVARLMLALPETLGRNATILDMIALMDDPAPYKPAIDSLPPIQKAFFERDFASKTFVQTKEQIRYRLNAILENPTLARLFTAPETKIDLFGELNRGSIILVDTAKDFLKGASAHFGRIFISLVLQAVLERAVIPERARKPTFLIVDEAAAYFDSNIDDFLTEARKYKCGCVFAHQFLDQATSQLRSSLAANTAIKMAGGTSHSDARALASDMRTNTDFILGQPRLQFAGYIRGVTPSAVSIPVPVGAMEAAPRLTPEAYERLREINRRKVSLPQAMRGEKFSGADAPPEVRDPEAQSRKPHEFRAGSEPARAKPDDPTAPSEDW